MAQQSDGTNAQIEQLSIMVQLLEREPRGSQETQMALRLMYFAAGGQASHTQVSTPQQVVTSVTESHAQVTKYTS